MTVGIIGAGAFGTALAVVRGLYGRPARLWTRDAAVAQAATARRVMPRLPGVILPPDITVTADLNDLDTAEVLLLALPMQALRGFLAEHAGFLDGRHLVACCKGVDLTTRHGPSALIAAACPAAVPLVLTGPSFAADIARRLPTALTLACRDGAAAAAVQGRLALPSLRLYRNSDVIGAELGGALKNVMAIACGACIGQGMGESARAALMTRGMAEIMRLATRLGGQADTLMGLSGFGDLVLTCTSEQSRNYRFGLALGRGEGFDPTVTVEGVATARAVARLAAEMDIDMPITTTLAGVLDDKASVTTAIHTLLSRPLKEE